jgi:hypothetical protein
MRYYKLSLIFGTYCLLLLLLVSSSASGQTLTGTILGTVTDATGAVVQGARITAVNTGTNQTRTTLTNVSGNYSIPRLSVGRPGG